MTVKRSRTPSDEVVADVLQAASRLLRAEGPDALSVRRIAAAAGVAPMSLYNRFDGKNGVLDALFRLGFDRLGEAFRTLDAGDPIENLRESGRRYRELALADPGTYTLMFEHSVVDFTPSDESMKHARATFEALVVLVRRALDQQRIRPGDPAEIAQRLWATSHGAVSLEIRGIGFVADGRAHHALLCDTLLRGLATDTDSV